LIVELFEFAHKSQEQVMALKNVSKSDRMPLKESDTGHKLTEIKPVFAR
jgi:hypothetical protein